MTLSLIYPQDIIDPVDGFHPSQTGMQLFAKHLWEFLEQAHPHFLGEENPNNAEIERIFGDQGGY